MYSQDSTVQDQDFKEQDQDRDQDSKNWVSRRLETKTWLSRTTSLCVASAS